MEPLLSCSQKALEACRHSISFSLPPWLQQICYKNLLPPWSRTRVNIYLTHLNSESGPPYSIRWICSVVSARKEKHSVLWYFSNFEGPSKEKEHWAISSVSRSVCWIAAVHLRTTLSTTGRITLLFSPQPASPAPQSSFYSHPKASRNSRLKLFLTF